MLSSEEVLRRLTMADPVFCDGLISQPGDPLRVLDAQRTALVRLSSTITIGSTGSMLRQRVSDTLAAGVDFDAIVTVLLVLVPTLGLERIVAMAPELARALDYDIDAALEELDDVPVVPPASIIGRAGA